MRNFLWYNIKAEEIETLLYKVESEEDKVTLVFREEVCMQILEAESHVRGV